MIDVSRLLLEGGLLLGAIALSGILFKRLQLSAIPAYILLGIALNTVIQNSELVEAFATFGVVLLLFFVGLEFSLGAFLRGRRLIMHGARDLIICFPLGIILAFLFGFRGVGALLVGGAFYMSSSAIIAKSIIELRRTANPETEVLLGILVFEDLAIAIFLALISGIALAGESLGAGLLGAVRGILFFAAAVTVAFLGRPLLNRLLDTDENDLFILLMAGVVLLLAWAASASGLSEAIGAFLAGTLMAESAHKERAEALFAPLQGLFAALFFVSFGLSVDLSTLKSVWPAAVFLALAALIAKLAAGWWAGRAEALSRRASFSLGLSLVPRGEFSVVLAGIATEAGVTRAAPIVTLMVLILAIAGTAGMRHSEAITRVLFPRKAERSLAEMGFDPSLAAHEPTDEEVEPQIESTISADTDAGSPQKL